MPVTRESNDHCKHTLPAKQMSAYFVSQNIISTKDEEEIIKPTTSLVRAATMLLNVVINPPQAGFGSCSVIVFFFKFLQQYGKKLENSVSNYNAKVEELMAEADLKGTLLKLTIIFK